MHDFPKHDKKLPKKRHSNLETPVSTHSSLCRDSGGSLRSLEPRLCGARSLEASLRREARLNRLSERAERAELQAGAAPWQRLRHAVEERAHHQRGRPPLVAPHRRPHLKHHPRRVRRPSAPLTLAGGVEGGQELRYHCVVPRQQRQPRPAPLRRRLRTRRPDMARDGPRRPEAARDGPRLPKIARDCPRLSAPRLQTARDLEQQWVHRQPRRLPPAVPCAVGAVSRDDPR
mmetsp:Transcript_1171/g.3158  ORF Transcript_1171/g.3158 Transcript_1171/m.3158 type:complete len:231 (-) Transcript_1171:5-697(-)